MVILDRGQFILSLHYGKNMSTIAIMSNIPLTQLPPTRIDPPEFARWRVYPAGIRGCNAITTSPSLSARLSSLSPILFSEEINLRIIDFNNLGGCSTSP